MRDAWDKQDPWDTRDLHGAGERENKRVDARTGGLAREQASWTPRLVLGAVAAAEGPELSAALDLERGGPRQPGRTELEA
jgi:hypothetical protein